MRYEQDRKQIPHHLQEARGMLGDAGIQHSLRYSKKGWPYVLFEAPAFEGAVSLQYRGMIKDRKTKEVTSEPHFLIFYPLDNGHQATRRCDDLTALIDALGIDDERIAEGRAGRDHLSQDDRAMSVVDPMQEASLVASMRR